jgi:hypothetical protein
MYLHSPKKDWHIVQHKSSRQFFTTGKICDNPLLHDTTAFPDSVFSGSGDSSNTYKDARITKGGWCPSESGTAYLTLDLQKEYHITQVVVMADKQQTKWSGGYSMEFSHNNSYQNIVQVCKVMMEYLLKRIGT